MMTNKLRYPALSHIRSDPVVQQQQPGLIEMVRIGKLLLEEPPLDGRERYRSFHRPLLEVAPRNRGGGAGSRGKPGDRLVFEYLPGRQFQSCLVGSRNDLDGEDGIPAHLEEVVVDSH